jgi:hypothetical protein
MNDDLSVEIDISGENILKLPVKPREPVCERFLVDVPYSKCNHWRGPFELDEKGGKCKCLKCGDEVSPIFVLVELMKQESRWMRTRESYLGEMKRLDERSRTKCQHCGEMTRISRT